MAIKMTPVRRILLCGFCTLLVLTIITLTVIAIVIATTFKTPGIQIDGARPPANPVLNFDIATGRIDTAAVVDTSIRNDNSYDIFISSITVVGSFSELPDVPFGTVDLDGVNLPGKGSTTPLEAPIAISWDPSKDPQGVVYSRLSGSCAGQGGTVSMVYRVQAYAKVWGFGPFKVPQFEKNVESPCPFTLPAGFNPSSLLKAIGV
jgi:hypothetical protein